VSGPIRVLLVEDHTLVREGLRQLLGLAPDIRLVGECEDGDAAVEAVPRLRPDVLLLDIRLPRRNGLEVLQALGEAGALPPTLVLTTFDDDELLLGAIRAGARGYLLKDVRFAVLVEAIRTLARGGTLIRPALTERAVRSLAGAGRSFPSAGMPDALTAREVDVLRLFAGGYSNREIAGALGLAKGTVKNHVHSILQKLGVRDRSRAMLKGIDLGYL
jgi:DNA-binding NarL/FixJ family response regulator